MIDILRAKKAFAEYVKNYDIKKFAVIFGISLAKQGKIV